MRVVVLTSLACGFPSICLAPLSSAPGIEVAAVILADRPTTGGWRNVKRRIQKILRIGPLAALNGIRMRRWFGEDTARHLAAPTVESEARRLGIAFHRVPAVNTEECRTHMRAASADLGLSLGNSYIAQSVFSIPRRGMVNIHHEILPDFQGAHSVIWQLHEGSRETGYTIHEIDNGIDTGRILLQERTPIEFRPTLGETVSWNYARLLKLSVAGLIRVIQEFETRRSAARPQGKGRKYTTPTLRQFLRMRRQHARLLAEERATR